MMICNSVYTEEEKSKWEYILTTTENILLLEEERGQLIEVSFKDDNRGSWINKTNNNQGSGK